MTYDILEPNDRRLHEEAKAERDDPEKIPFPLPPEEIIERRLHEEAKEHDREQILDWLGEARRGWADCRRLLEQAERERDEAGDAAREVVRDALLLKEQAERERDEALPLLEELNQSREVANRLVARVAALTGQLQQAKRERQAMGKEANHWANRAEQAERERDAAYTEREAALDDFDTLSPRAEKLAEALRKVAVPASIDADATPLREIARAALAELSPSTASAKPQSPPSPS